MSESGTTATLTESLIPAADLCAALAEIDALSATVADPPADGLEPADETPPAEPIEESAPDTEPSNDPQPTATPQADDALEQTQDSPANEELPPTDDTPRDEPAPVKRLQFKMGAASAQTTPAPEPVDAPPTESPELELELPEIDEVIQAPVTPLHKRIYRVADRMLDQINIPFGRLRKQHREMLGWIALATTVVSVLTMVVMPILLPQRDAVTFLQEKRWMLDHPAPPEPAADAEESEDEP